jgi:hypothetical protein
MSDILFAFGISAAVLLSVVVLIIIVSIVAVNRGAQEMAASEHGHTSAAVEVKDAAAAPAAKPGKAAAPVVDVISVPQILGLGLGLFVVAVLALFALSLIEHLV